MVGVGRPARQDKGAGPHRAALRSRKARRNAGCVPVSTTAGSGPAARARPAAEETARDLGVPGNAVGRTEGRWATLLEG